MYHQTTANSTATTPTAGWIINPNKATTCNPIFTGTAHDLPWKKLITSIEVANTVIYTQFTVVQ